MSSSELNFSLNMMNLSSGHTGSAGGAPITRSASVEAHAEARAREVDLPENLVPVNGQTRSTEPSVGERRGREQEHEDEGEGLSGQSRTS